MRAIRHSFLDYCIASNEQAANGTYAHTLPAYHDLSLSVNPLGHSPQILEQFSSIAAALDYDSSRYPKLKGHLEQKLADFYGVTSDQIYIGGRGVEGIISSIFGANLITDLHFLIVPEATFPIAAYEAKRRKTKIITIPLRQDFGIDWDKMTAAAEQTEANADKGAIFICNPNNPTGIVEATSAIIELAKKFPHLLIIVSEANMEFVSATAVERIGGSLLEASNIKQLPPNLLVLRSFSKAYGLANDRTGYAIGHPALIQTMTNNTAAFTVSDYQSIRAMLALQDQQHIETSRLYMASEMAALINGLQKLGFVNLTKTDANMVLVKVPKFFQGQSEELVQALKQHHCSVVKCGQEFGQVIAEKYIRLSPNLTTHNTAFLQALAKVCDEKWDEDFDSGQQTGELMGTRIA